MQRVLNAGSKAVDIVGGAIPVTAQEFALRAFRAASNPLGNPVKEVQDAFSGGTNLHSPPQSPSPAQDAVPQGPPVVRCDILVLAPS